MDGTCCAMNYGGAVMQRAERREQMRCVGGKRAAIQGIGRDREAGLQGGCCEPQRDRRGDLRLDERRDGARVRGENRQGYMSDTSARWRLSGGSAQ